MNLKIQINSKTSDDWRAESQENQLKVSNCWNPKIDVSLHNIEDMLKALRVLLTMHNLRRHVHSLRETPFFLSANIADTLEKTFGARWKMVFTNVHYVRALLNPYIRDHLSLKVDGIALCTLNRVWKLEDVVGVRFDNVIEELTQYDKSTIAYSSAETSNIQDSKILK